MAQRVEVRLTDDLDGTEIPSGKGETITFSLDGKSYEIDLTAKNASVLRKALRRTSMLVARLRAHTDARSALRSVPTP
jgi:hypothetical protein